MFNGGKSPTKQKILVPLKLRQCLFGVFGVCGGSKEQETSENVSRAMFLLSRLLFNCMTKEVHGDTKVCKQTLPEATQASGCFFLTGICWVSDVQLAKCNLGRKEAN